MQRRIRSPRNLVGCAAILALGAIVGAAVSQSWARSGPSPDPKIIAPQNGQRAGGGPVLIKLQLGGVHAVGVRLNGRPIASQFLLTPGRVSCGLAIKSRRARTATCRLSASPNDGLRHGVNVLWVRFGTGGAARVRTVRFRVATARPLAAAGRDPSEFVPIDQRFLLDGRASLIAAGLRQRLARRGRRVALRYRWRVIRGPRGTQPGDGDDGPGSYDPYGKVPGELAGANSSTPSVELDREGVFTVRLTVTQPDRRTGSDDITLVAGGEGGGAVPDPPIDPAPLVGVNTGASESGQRGIELDPYRDIPLPGCPTVIPSNTGSACFYAGAADSQSAQLIVLSRSDLSLVENKTFPCNDQQACRTSVGDYLRSLNNRELVIGENLPWPGGRGSLVWVPTRQSPSGIEPVVGVISTHLAVNSEAQYAPLSIQSSGGGDDPPADKVLTQAATPWPAMSAGELAALSRLGREVGLGPDPRAAFYSQSKDWSGVQTKIDGARFDTLTPKPTDFESSDYEAAKLELRNELDDVNDVKSYFENLAAPYAGASKTLWADFQKSVSDIVNTDTANGAAAHVVAIASQVAQTILGIIPGVGSLFEWKGAAKLAADVVTKAIATGLKLAGQGGESANSSFTVETASLGKELSDRLDAAEEAIRTREFNIVVADWGKLRTVALCSQSLPACPDSDPAWAATSDINSIQHVQDLLKLGLQRELFTKLVPVKYPLAVALLPVSSDNAPAASADAAKFCPPSPPFEHTTGVWLWPKVDLTFWQNHYRYRPDWAFTPIVLTSGKAGFGGTWHAASWTVFGRMFNAFDNGGLGINEADFMGEHYGIRDQISNTSENFMPFGNVMVPDCQWIF
jgi:hypothetical protein